MGVVDTVAAAERNDKLEEKASLALMPYARNLARKYSTHKRWLLDKNELFGELCLEIAKVIQHYLYVEPKPYDEVLKLTRVALYYRYQEILSKATETTRERELSAYVLDDEMDFGSSEDSGYSFSDFSMDFTKGLSDLAKCMVSLVLNPNDEMIVHLNEYVKARNTKYVHGAGVRKIPLKIFAAVTGEPIFNIRAANNEIRKKLMEVDNMAVEMRTKAEDEDTGEFLASFDYPNELVTAFMTAERYSVWGRDALIDQATFRGLEANGLKRGKIGAALHKYDIEHVLPTQDEIISAAHLASPVAVIMTKKDISTGEDDEFDTKFLKKNGNDKEEIDESNEVAEFFSDKAPDPDDDGEEEQVEVEEPVAVPAVSGATKVAPAKTKTIMTDTNPFTSMPIGTTMIVTRLGEHEWHIKIIESEEQATTKTPVGATKDNPDPDPIVKPEKAEGGKKTAIEKTTEDGVKFKNNSKAWRELVLSPDYVKFMAEVPEDMVELKRIAKAADCTWKKQTDAGAERRGILLALRKVRGIKKYKPLYRTREDRKAVTL